MIIFWKLLLLKSVVNNLIAVDKSAVSLGHETTQGNHIEPDHVWSQERQSSDPDFATPNCLPSSSQREWCHELRAVVRASDVPSAQQTTTWLTGAAKISLHLWRQLVDFLEWLPVASSLILGFLLWIMTWAQEVLGTVSSCWHCS